eukprot:6208776-Pleurochrysis_carterae.AAC.2
MSRKCGAAGAQREVAWTLPQAWRERDVRRFQHHAGGSRAADQDAKIDEERQARFADGGSILRDVNTSFDLAPECARGGVSAVVGRGAGCVRVEEGAQLRVDAALREGEGVGEGGGERGVGVVAAVRA